MNLLKFLFDLLVPRFIEEWICMYEGANGLSYAFPVKELLPRDPTPDAMVKVSCFTWFLLAFFPMELTDPISYADFLANHWSEK